jgi:thiamine-phosphate pyrophosphorylase
MLQLITDGSSVQEIVSQSQAAIRGGCRWIQVRMKEASDEEVSAVVKAIRPLCATTQTTLLLDDRVQLAKALLVDGVHLGKLDMSPWKRVEYWVRRPLSAARPIRWTM